MAEYLFIKIYFLLRLKITLRFIQIQATKTIDLLCFDCISLRVTLTVFMVDMDKERGCKAVLAEGSLHLFYFSVCYIIFESRRGKAVV